MSMIVMMGLPRSGKSTWANNYVKKHKDWILICPDDIRITITGKRWYAPAEPVVWGTVKTMVRYFLMQKRNIIIDGTFLTKQSRAFFISTAIEFKTRIKFMHIKTKAMDCMVRANETGYPELVEVIKEMLCRYEKFNMNEIRDDKAKFLIEYDYM